MQHIVGLPSYDSYYLAAQIKRTRVSDIIYQYRYIVYDFV
jgi:hypothetical protein